MLWIQVDCLVEIEYWKHFKGSNLAINNILHINFKSADKHI